jgi:GT2 family glycosyltransferase
MQASIVIPVWNGEAVLPDCLESIYKHSGSELLEVICVDNDSRDGSAALIAGRYPRIRLLRQPVNLGFAGGVNAGIEAARGDVFVLLNQDCIAQPGWLTALVQALEENAGFGVAGCTILNADGTLNHTGACVRRPDAYGIHLTERTTHEPASVECVTGAAMAIRRETWNAVGRFDEGYYPAYYEDSDYCYRARRKGFGVAYVPNACVAHLCSGREWLADPLRHTANQHLARYRFVGKHFDMRETADFFQAELEALQAEDSYDQVLGRVLAARDILRSVADVIERRRADLDDRPAPTHRRRLQSGFAQVGRMALATAIEMTQVGLIEPPVEEWEAANQRLQGALRRPVAVQPPRFPGEEEADRLLQELQQREHDLLARIHFRSPTADEPESRFRRLFRLLVLRPLSFLVGRDYLLLSELNAVHVMRIDLITQQTDRMRQRMGQVDDWIAQLIHASNSRMEQVDRLCHDRLKQQEWLYRYRQEQLARRLKLLEALINYEYR